MSLNGFQDPAVLAEETVWLDASKLQEAETRYQVFLANEHPVDLYAMGDGPHIKPGALQQQVQVTSSLVSEIENVRSKIQNFMKAADGKDLMFPGQIMERLEKVEKETHKCHALISGLEKDFCTLISKVNAMGDKFNKALNLPIECDNPTVDSNLSKGSTAEDDDDDVDLFGSDEETEDERRVKEERVKTYENKKAKKAQVIAKSSVVLDVKPWSDETDLKAMEYNVRNIESVGLIWGASKFVPVGYGIKKLQIVAIVEDDNCSIDWLQEQIEAIGDLVQSVDIAAFNKL